MLHPNDIKKLEEVISDILEMRAVLGNIAVELTRLVDGSKIPEQNHNAGYGAMLGDALEAVKHSAAINLGVLNEKN